MHPLAHLERIFASGAHSIGTEHLLFNGSLSAQSDGRSALEHHLGYTIPDEIANFISVFGGTELFVDCFGLGIKILPFQKIYETNIGMEELKEQFFPKYVIFGFDSTDDMLCLYCHEDNVHFGVLDHEAWGEPDIWASEALMFVKFSNWLEFLIETGETIPPSSLRYET
jgi:hypothetical protein